MLNVYDTLNKVMLLQFFHGQNIYVCSITTNQLINKLSDVNAYKRVTQR